MGNAKKPEVTFKNELSPIEWKSSLFFVVKMCNCTQAVWINTQKLRSSFMTIIVIGWCRKQWSAEDFTKMAPSPSPSGEDKYRTSSPILLQKNWFGNFPWGQTSLSQPLLLSKDGVYRRKENCSYKQFLSKYWSKPISWIWTHQNLRQYFVKELSGVFKVLCQAYWKLQVLIEIF